MITLKDIAGHAGVSTCTVSHVLSGKHKIGRINEKTRKHVSEVAANLGYRRNAIASAIKMKRSNVFGVMGLFMHQFHLRRSTVFQKRRWKTVICSTFSYLRVWPAKPFPTGNAHIIMLQRCA